MDKVSTVHQSIKSSKQFKSKKKPSKPIKVVYISSPMKVKTSASEFRALVQELTGRDSDLGGYNGRFLVDGLEQKVTDEVMKIRDDYEPQVPQIGDFHQESSSGRYDDTLIEVDQPFDDFFSSSGLLENFYRFTEPPQVDVIRNFGAV
ncbi:uncharacterized protein LOC122079139 [Macadamia integrifolia]|uniref:uncharacterized protein LOC122079139 n=1 Tax=Macadamia integrifolia TaxID=60698 RepID=UPI001C4FBD0B|nr:uncharacterized protein LOC122079139 [Macadamia integrifolia]